MNGTRTTNVWLDACRCVLGGALLLLGAVALAQAPATRARRYQPTPGVRVNTIGYLPASAKRATAAGSPAAASEFSVVSVKSSQVVFTGALAAPRYHPDSGESVRSIDFSAFKQPGEYILRVSGLPDSPAFQIAPGVYNASLRLNLLGFYGQRCGVPVRLEHDGVVYEKGACHLGDAYLDYYDATRAGETRDGTGGWHDAGDYGKYTVNAAFTTGIMLMAWEHYGDKLSQLKAPIPESGSSLPDFLAEVKFNLDWLLKMQFPDGRVSHKLTSLRFCPMIMPTEDKDKRYFVAWGTEATVDFAAVFAQAARVFRPFDPAYADKCQAAAQKAMDVVRSEWEEVRPDQSAFRTGGYVRSSESDRIWALAEYWESTGDENARRRLEQRLNSDKYAVDVDWDWGEGRNLGVYTYLLSARPRDEAVVSAVKEDLIAAADRTVRQHDRHGYGRGLRSYYWGANGSLARLALNLLMAHRLTGEHRYLDAVVDQLAYLYGRNPYGRSFVTGDGHNPPRFPHHRPSAADGIETPWPGHLVGGGHPTELDWQDVTEHAPTNENAINWDASLAYALAAFYDPNAR